MHVFRTEYSVQINTYCVIRTYTYIQRSKVYSVRSTEYTDPKRTYLYGFHYICTPYADFFSLRAEPNLRGTSGSPHLLRHFGTNPANTF